MTYQEAAQTVLDMQDASNLSGIIFSLPDIMQAICSEGNRLGKGTEWRNTNPIVSMFISKLGDLNRGRFDQHWPTDYDTVKMLAEGLTSEAIELARSELMLWHALEYLQSLCGVFGEIDKTMVGEFKAMIQIRKLLGL
jgi:hypothetical protein